ncbi:uncharacterized protein K444DRAFT_714174 [Hyaloscypha bicolor E]|uniref:Uncharacterized protein n=1 Tax=Hyaloscypha bicolor E TaxID=1095630 RepID=A0A2J6TMM6_9HELO|nr:uncharacterized protein K444DRAFT_714174 [Hyaloscypha bicolor E]PMD64276.1 hypothetical protein K444DRAFT_714174 [Hyaloscypha bicolor E]
MSSPTVDNQNFANNLFTDIAPLLVLFGDETTKQFLSTSMGWADNMLLAICPIGIMTIIISAIRISGNTFLKSVISRARDSADEEEKELLSSTSATVREIWDGHRVVRQTGEPTTLELILISNWKEPKPEGYQRPPFKNALNPLDEVLYAVSGSKLGLDDPYRGTVNPDVRRLISGKAPPNLTLNIAHAVPAQRKVVFSVCLGILIQVAMIVVNAIAVYHLHWLRAGRAVASYGFPSGRLEQSALLLECHCVPEQFSVVRQQIFYAHSNSNPHRGERDRVANLPAYLIFTDESNPQIKISRRIWPWIENDDNKMEPSKIEGRENQSNISEIERGEKRSVASKVEKQMIKSKMEIKETFLTILGTLLALFGFFCQNIGTRELHWSAAVLQLGGTVTVSFLRALLRRHVGRTPDPLPIPMRMLTGAGASQLALCLEGLDEKTVKPLGCYMLSEKPYQLEDARHHIYPPNDETLRSPKMVHELLERTRQDSFEPETDFDCTRTLRILNMQSTLTQYEPDLDDIAGIASRLFLLITTTPQEGTAPPFTMGLDRILGHAKDGISGKQMQDDLMSWMGKAYDITLQEQGNPKTASVTGLDSSELHRHPTLGLRFRDLFDI